ncbi:MAG TPA: hydantoinase/carbamoylase family amidase [Alphaproteobacteria bacterium]|nr:hydantoinase/carbamoylase family amidase [Alphaproteobacteria bacterium]
MSGVAKAKRSDAGHEAALHELAARIFDDIAAMSPDVAGVSRPAYSPVESKVLDYLEGVARAHGLCTWRDAGANLVIARSNDVDRDARCGLIGSHVDSVPQGGNFDGLAGVVAGLLTLVAFEGGKVELGVPVRVLALRGEESAWFGQAYMGSKALLGKMTDAVLQSRHRDSGSTLGDAMAAVGVPVDRVRNGEALVDPASFAFFLELHIEQGPILIDRGWPLAAVTGIRGNIRHRGIQCVGEAGHSGAVPRWLRHDAVVATAELVMRMDEHWATIQQHGGDLVLTTGIFQTDAAHHAMSRIPGEATFSFEARSQEQTTMNAIENLLHSECRIIERERGVRFHFDDIARAEPAELDERIVEAIKAACVAEGLPNEAVASGAGHDAAVFAQAGVPTGMIFVRNANGSHNPNEHMDLDDFMAAVTVMRRVASELTQ